MTRHRLASLARALGSAAVLLEAAAASAAVLEVPASYSSIQAAVDAASHGDEIVVAPGTYGPVTSQKQLIIRGVGGPSVTTIDCGITDPGTQGPPAGVAHSDANGFRLEGFTITRCGYGFMTYRAGGVVVSDVVIQGNISSGIYTSTFAYLTVDHCRIAGNLSPWGGGGINTWQSFVTVNDSVIEDNTAGVIGGGISAGGCYGQYALHRTVVRNNHVTGRVDGTGGQGGGVFVDGGASGCSTSLTLDNSVVSGNTALHGGAAWVQAASLGLSWTTVADNHASSNHEGISVDLGGTIGVSDSIVYFNDPSPSLPTWTVSSSDIQGASPGNGVIAADPLFVNAAVGDYSLSEGSSCRDAGGGAVAYDVLNNCRPLGAGYDMGAYEFVPAGSDADGDGSLVCRDCNDADPSVHPGAAEVCDGKDNNCDGRIDEGFDADGDGYTTCGGDCNDADPNVHPGAAEIVRDGIDQDCNGHDLTIMIGKAEWRRGGGTLTVDATSLRGAQAALRLPLYGVAMIFNKKTMVWSATVRVPSNPGAVSVSGPEGSVTASVATR